MWIDRRGLLAAGAASLLLNVFLLGIVLGHVFVMHKTVRPPMRGGTLILPARVLAPADRQAFGAAMAPHRPAIRAAREEWRAARQTIEQDITAADFDRGKVDSDFARLRETNSTISKRVDDALLDALAAISADARGRLVRHFTPQARP